MNGKSPVIVKADTTYEAQQMAAKQWKTSKGWSITVMLVEKEGKTVEHSTGAV